MIKAKAPGEDRELFRVAFDEGFWESLVEPAPVAVPALAVAAVDATSLARDGVVPLGPVVPGHARDLALRLFAALRHRGWPLVFAALHPRFWEVFAADRLAAALASVMGEGFQLAPRLWPTHVAPVGGAGGWRPHLDATRAPRADASAPDRLTLWLALTDATVDNGCMYVVPRDVAGAFPSDVFSARDLDAVRVTKLLHGARALPCHAGDGFVWWKDVIHWGGKASGDSTSARVSLATEVVRAGTRPDVGEGEWLPLGAPPPFVERVRLVGRQLKKYAAYDEERHALTPLLPLADQMLRA